MTDSVFGSILKKVVLGSVFLKKTTVFDFYHLMFSVLYTKQQI